MRRLAILVCLLLFSSATASGAQDADAGFPGASSRYGFEIKAHYRDSDAVAFPSPFPFSQLMIPAGQDRVVMATPESGEHAEVSVVTLFFDGRWRDGSVGAKLKVDFIDRYDRNPTSEAEEFDVDEAWLRIGRESEPGDLPEDPWGAYVKLGKFPKAERQDDRHLESYGIVATAFNRFEDVGVEVGVDLGRYFYVKGSFTQGNPVFLRDPNALAGDQGTPILDGRVANPVPELGTGFPIFYETDAQDLDFGEPEVGLGVGLRFGDASGRVGGDVLVFGYSRDLAATVDIDGSFYGGDLDLLLGPGNETPAPIVGNEKEEIGANLWLYAGGLSVFAQYVDQEIAGLPRVGFEAEVAWSFELPFITAVGGRQLFSFIQPVVRYSEIDNDFRTHPEFPAPSAMWDWEKIDYGLRLGLLADELDLTVEVNDNDFIRAGEEESADEFLATLRWAMDWKIGG